MSRETEKSPLVRHLIQYAAIVLGSFIYALGFQLFMLPNNIVAGGVTGVAMIINAFTHWPIGLMVILINIPIFAYGWRHFGLEFLLASVAGMAISSAFVDLLAMFNLPSATLDPMLASIIGGVIKGAGLGMIYYVGATTGGVDIVAKVLRQKQPHINFGTIVMMIDIAIIAAYAIALHKLESAMYSMIAMFVVSKVIDAALYGIDNSVLCYIISEKSMELTQEIINGTMHRGVTLLQGEGAYSHAPKKVILCVIKRTQIAALRRVVRSVDEHAFFVVSDAKNVFGKGFDNIAEVK
jgi:uncharacterized membrane-anchored protein YitT (DUF2179 family)